MSDARAIDQLERLPAKAPISFDEAGLLLGYSAATVARMARAGAFDAAPWGKPLRLAVGAVRRYRDALHAGDVTWPPSAKPAAPREAAALDGRTRAAGRTSASTTEASGSNVRRLTPRGRKLL